MPAGPNRVVVSQILPGKGFNYMNRATVLTGAKGFVERTLNDGDKASTIFASGTRAQTDYWPAMSGSFSVNDTLG